MLTITNLHAQINTVPILKGLTLNVKPGEVHAIMGPNGSGKSTLAHVLMGHPQYHVSDGSIMLDDEEMIGCKADKRAHRGLFLAFQYPKEIPGVSVASFLKTAVASIRKARGLSELNPIEFRKTLREKLSFFGLNADFMNRSINDGFSGGEKKKVEILQMALLEPRIAILDETDSGLDVDALRIVSKGINACMSSTQAMILITHYQRILHYVKPHFVHVMIHGKIIMSGDHTLGEKIEKEGYDWIQSEKNNSELN